MKVSDPLVKPVGTPGVVLTTTDELVTVTAHPGLLAVKVYTPASPVPVEVIWVLSELVLAISPVVGPVHAYVAAPVAAPVSVSILPVQIGFGVADALTPVG